MKVYPIKFEPILKEKIWGGQKLATKLNKKLTLKNIGESWEISGVKDNISVVSNGFYKGEALNDLIRKYSSQFVGEQNFSVFGDNFPLLIKFLDAKTNLSVQVHPDDKMAKKHHDSFGKTEMWYIMDSDEDAEIVLGLKNTNIDPSVLANINSKNVNEIFNTEKVKKGNGFFIPAGKIHAIGAGVLAAEIQQTSDITYRVYDWDRKDASGKGRDLHTNLAIEATKPASVSGKSNYSLATNKTSNLVDCEFFTTNIFKIEGIHKRNYKAIDSFVIFMCVEGDVGINANGHVEHLKTGDTVLLPANTEKVDFNSQGGKLLEVYIH